MLSLAASSFPVNYLDSSADGFVFVVSLLTFGNGSLANFIGCGGSELKCDNGFGFTWFVWIWFSAPNPGVIRSAPCAALPGDFSPVLIVPLRSYVSLLSLLSFIESIFLFISASKPKTSDAIPSLKTLWFRFSFSVLPPNSDFCYLKSAENAPTLAASS